MTNDQPIRFRTFADEDDVVWSGRDDRRQMRPAGFSTVEPEEPYFGAALPPVERRRAGPGTFLAWGAGLALVAGVAIAVTLLPKPGAVVADNGTSAAALRVHRYVAPQPGRLASSALLPCYVNGASVGSLTLADCGARNGVASGRLDVGLAPPPATTLAAASPAPEPARAGAPTEAYDQPAAIGPRTRPAPLRAASPAPAAVNLFAQRQSARPETVHAAPDRAPRTLYAEPPRDPAAAQYVPRAYAYDRADRPDESSISPEDSVRAAQTFYEGLADADGARAASVVVPEKRRQGPLSRDSISRYYSSLRAPLRLTRLYPLDDHTVMARYAFVDHNGEICQGAARVTTTQRDGEVYVQGIRALNGC